MTDWKRIDGYENYEVSNFGFIRSKKSGKYLKGSLDKDGYFRVNLYKTKVDKSFVYVHRIVGLAFIDNLENKSQIDHIDNIPTNNNISNLRWATHSENNRNTKLQKNNKSEIKGVCWCKESKKWRAHIHIDGINISLGSYKNIEDAKIARIKKVNEVFGAFVNHSEKLN